MHELCAEFLGYGGGLNGGTGYSGRCDGGGQGHGASPKGMQEHVPELAVLAEVGWSPSVDPLGRSSLPTKHTQEGRPNPPQPGPALPRARLTAPQK